VTVKYLTILYCIYVPLKTQPLQELQEKIAEMELQRMRIKLGEIAFRSPGSLGCAKNSLGLKACQKLLQYQNLCS